MRRSCVSAPWLLAVVALTWMTVPMAAAQTCLCGSAGDEFVAAGAGLVREWVVQIPFDSAGWRLGHVVVGDDLIVAQSGDGGVHVVQASEPIAGGAFSARPGCVLWSERVGQPGGPMQQAGIGSAVVTVARDLDVYGFDAATGRQLWQRPSGHAASAAAVPVGKWAFVPLQGDGMLKMPADPQSLAAAMLLADGPEGRRRLGGNAAAERKVLAALEPLSLQPGGDVSLPPQRFGGIPRLVTDAVLWLTTRGKLVVLSDAPKGWERYEREIGGAPSGAPIVRGLSVFVASQDNAVMRLDLVRKAGITRIQDAWVTNLDDQPEAGPLLHRDTVVVSLGPAGIAAFSARTGANLWRSPTVGRLVAGVGERIWCHAETGRLEALDLASGGRRETLCIGCFTLPVVNTVTEKLLLASPGGLLVSLASGRDPAPAAEAVQPKAEAAGQEQPPAEEQPAANPFEQDDNAAENAAANDAADGG